MSMLLEEKSACLSQSKTRADARVRSHLLNAERLVDVPTNDPTTVT